MQRRLYVASVIGDDRGNRTVRPLQRSATRAFPEPRGTRGACDALFNGFGELAQMVERLLRML